MELGFICICRSTTNFTRHDELSACNSVLSTTIILRSQPWISKMQAFVHRLARIARVSLKFSHWP